ncbi:RNA polymerase II elongation factor ELL3 isoform X3 [Oxyura jamaicensis]|uniref:RNA polymerase II elongation factor ELL3 isoform X3 n=1 Tax=Oxyura jamaicensis TaxID=8884 RepID=UPI0015A6C7BB|nr:RNA polymerase II elongation factor ELL3 isoform X3 [Oxyura jamaicensis]
MPRARTELRGRLRYRGCGRGPRLSLLHVRLSEAAARALRGCQQRQGAPGPAIAFQGSQGCLTVPGGPGTCPRLFAFFLSRCSRDEPQASFECVRLAAPRLGQSWLDSVGSIQEKITVCASEGTYSMLQERVSQSKEPWSRAVTEPDVAVPGYGKGVTAPEKAGTVSGTVSVLQQSSLCHIREGKNHWRTAASPRAAAQSLVQLLALRPHRKHELLQRLAGTQAGRPDWAGLLAALEEVADLDPIECCYRLKQSLVGRVQEDWPGYTAQERRQVALLQHSSQPHGPTARSFLVPLQQPLECGSPLGAGGNHLGVRLALLDFSNPRVSKRHRSCLRTFGTRQPGARGQQQAGPLPPSSDTRELQGAEQGESREEADNDQEEGAPCPEQRCSAPRDNRSQPSSSSLAEIPDYLRKYHTIRSAEQCRSYEAAFSADYAEYRYLHTRIGSVSQKFIQLGARMKTLKQGTEERKALEAKILYEYSHFKKSYPSYQQEKNRCEYLHQKLSHIKSLILQFEGRGNS